MTRRSRIVLGAAFVLASATGIILLREVTESRRLPTGPNTRTVVEVEARTNLEQRVPTLHDLVTASLTTCRFEIRARPVGPADVTLHGDRFRIVLAPALDKHEGREYRGCLEDWRVDHLALDVVTMETVTLGR